MTWLAMYDLKAHALSRTSFPGLRGPILIPIGLAIVVVTARQFFHELVFGFASSTGRPESPAIKQPGPSYLDPPGYYVRFPSLFSDRASA